jgi:hypothetical protein
VIENKRDLSISMARANLIVLFTSIPVALLQFLLFSWIHGIANMGTTWDFNLLIIGLLLGVIVHELIGISCDLRRKPFSRSIWLSMELSRLMPT